MDDQVSVSWWQLKIITAWAAIGITSWTDAAAFMGFCYTACLMGEWVWKNFFRPWLEDYGVIKSKRSPKADDNANG